MNGKITPKIISSIYIILLICISIVTSCKKNTDEPSDPFAIDKSKTYLSDTYENNLRDSVWYYYKTLSLWQDVIPPTLNNDMAKLDEPNFLRNNYTQYFQTSDEVLTYLKSLTKNRNPDRKLEKNYDRYSFIDRGRSVSTAIQETMSSGLGLTLLYLKTENSGNNADLYIRYVDNNSPAQLAGLQRGDQVISINGDIKLDYDYQKSQKFSSLTSYLQAYTITIKVRKVTGEHIEKTLNYREFNSNPIVMNSVLTINSQKVGYFLFNSFASIKYKSTYTTFYRELENVFNRFEQQGITELVIDLRNNGGGDVETAEYLANWIAPASENGKLMYTYKVNKTIENWGWLNEGKTFAPVKFQKRGNLKLNRIYFLVSPNTASASELLINSLKPIARTFPTYMVGTYSINENNQEVADKTYGKPVGFFGLKVVNDNVELYVSSFKMHNRDGEGDYYDGLTPSTHVWEFKSFHDFGNKEETMLATALNHIQRNSFTTSPLKASLEKTGNKQFIQVRDNADINANNSNTGMYKFKK